MRRPGHDALYNAGHAFLERALCHDDSLFTPGRAVWTAAACQDLQDRMWRDPSAQGFAAKLAAQLEGAAPALHQLAAEALYVHLLITDKISPATKRSSIAAPLAGAGGMAIPAELDAALDEGLIGTGVEFSTGRAYSMLFLLKLASAWKARSGDEQAQMAADPWQFKAFLNGVVVPHSVGQREALLHLVHPDVFLDIISVSDKQRIAARFAEQAGTATDIDQQLASIWQALAQQEGSEFSFYDPVVRHQWSSNWQRWDEFSEWAKRMDSSPGFYERERAYKHTIYGNVMVAREAFLASQFDWHTLLKRAFGPPNNLTPWQAHDAFIKWCQSVPDAAGSALRACWTAAEPLDGLKAFLQQLPQSVLASPGARLAIGSFLLGGMDSASYPIYRPTPFQKAYELLQVDKPPKNATEAAAYEHALALLDQISEEAAARGLVLDDRLHVQSVLWAVVKTTPDEEPLVSWTADDRQRFLRFRGEVPPDPDDVPEPKEVPPPVAEEPLRTAPPPLKKTTFSDVLAAIAKENLYFSPELVANYLLALQTKRFVILTGISGTGKTQLAMAVARAFAPLVAARSIRPSAAEATAVEVKPYMLKYHRMYVPSTVVLTLDTPPTADGDKSGPIQVTYPGGTTTLNFWKEPRGTLFNLNFKGDFRTWFDKTFQAGDTLMLDVEPSESGEGDGLRFTVPAAEVVQEPLKNFEVVAVRPDWTDSRGLLGYFNPLTQQYVMTPFLDLLLRADAEVRRAREEGRPPAPFFAILDEMNLARVEHYFSDFLSHLESEEPLPLHTSAATETGETADGIAVPRWLDIPANLFFVGTVNVDETTYMFSPKVLDRAFTIELDEVDLASYRTPPGGSAAASPLTLQAFTGLSEHWNKPDATDWDTLGDIEGGEFRARLTAINELLARWHRHFGYRVANEISRFVARAAEQTASDGDAALQGAFDLAVLQKVMPKLHGTQQELEEPLAALFSFAVRGNSTEPWVSPEKFIPGQGVLEQADGEVESFSPPYLPRTALKLARMIQRLRQQGFTSFIE